MVWTFYFDIDLDIGWRARKQGVIIIRVAFSLSNENINQYQNGNDLPVKVSLAAYYSM
jgi:hypothetical protein